MTPEERLATCEAEIAALQQQVDNRDAFNNSLAFKMNKALFDLKRLTERDNESTSKP